MCDAGQVAGRSHAAHRSAMAAVSRQLGVLGGGAAASVQHAVLGGMEECRPWARRPNRLQQPPAHPAAGVPVIAGFLHLILRRSMVN